MTPERRKYILDHLAKVTPGDNWIRIQTIEFDELGGREFFLGCYAEYLRDEKYFTTRVGQRGWTKEERIQLPWKITAPRGGFHPNGGWATYAGYTTTTTGEIIVDPALDPQLANEIVNAINEGNTMEHHVNPAVIIDVLNAGQERYDDLYRRFKDLYTVKLRARVEAHLDGANINHLSLSLSDAEGNIGLLPNNSDRYEDMILAMELDVREEIVMTEGEFESFAEHKGVDNSKDLELAIARLERLA